MLLQYQAENFASIRNRAVLNLISLKKRTDIAMRPLPGAGDGFVLPAAGIFGANASGKSNLLESLMFMRDAVLNSHQRWLPDDAIPRRPFLLDPECAELPSRFEVDFLFDGERVNYGFTCDDRVFTGEWLNVYGAQTNRKRVLFKRDHGRPMSFGLSFSGPKRGVERLMRPNSLFLSTAAANNSAALTPIYEWFRDAIRFATDSNDIMRLRATLDGLQTDARVGLIALLRYADLGVLYMKVSRPTVSKEWETKLGKVFEALEISAPIPNVDSLPPRIEVQHTAKGEPVFIDFGFESSGTQTWLSMLGPIVNALRDGSVLVVDEIDARLHPTLVAAFLRLFQDPRFNRKGAQLVFNSHDVTLLNKQNPNRLHKDQIWFTERVDLGTELYALREYDGVRDDRDNFEANYLTGRYGALPFLDETILADLLGDGADG